MEQDDYQQTLATGIQAGDENDSIAQKIMNGGRTILQAMVYPIHDDLANKGFQEVDAIPDGSCLLKTPKSLPDCRVARYTKPGASLFMVSHTVMTPPTIVSGEEGRCFADAEDVPYVAVVSAFANSMRIVVQETGREPEIRTTRSKGNFNDSKWTEEELQLIIH